MKTKELIRQLQEADPSGEEEVCVDNVDIHFIETLPAYYDGKSQVLIRDRDCQYYNITGAKYRRNGLKVQIHSLSIVDALSNLGSREEAEEFKIDYSELAEQDQVSAKAAHEKIIQWCEDLHLKMEWENFYKWAKAKAEKVTVDLEEFERVAKRFFDLNDIGHQKIIILPGNSQNGSRQQQYEDFCEVVVDPFLEIRKK